MDEEVCRVKSKFVTEQLKNHEERIEELEKTYSIMQKMDFRMGKVEEAVEKVEVAVGKIDTKITAKVEEKGKKWDKLVDYIFYAILAGLLAYISHQLGLN